jgi:hypothetical protein
MRQQTPLRHHRLTHVVALADDQSPLGRGEVEPVLVFLGDGDLEPLTDGLSTLTRCEPAAHESAVFRFGRTDPLMRWGAALPGVLRWPLLP